MMTTVQATTGSRTTCIHVVLHDQPEGHARVRFACYPDDPRRLAGDKGASSGSLCRRRSADEGKGIGMGIRESDVCEGVLS